ncbi:MAG: PQQ-binding-like beta-propeller repeat protein [Clostridia bacterium]|nr:PQQ-binding-like beta-propeller repeat protein [Clostridia bacterium]
MNSRDRHPRLPQHGRRGRRAHRWLRTRRYVVAGALLCAAVAALLAVAGTRGRRSADVAAGPVPEATPAEATQAAVPTSEPTAEPTPATTQALPVLTPDPPGEQRPDHPAWGYGYEVYTDGQRVDAFESDTLSFPEDGTYTALEGVLTFRGGNLRQNGAYGSAALEARDFKVLWSRRIGAIDSGYTRWTGVGWTGQPVLVRWPEDLRRGMNIDAAFQSRDDLVEGIYGTLDGNIYFFEAGTGKPTRPPIKLGFPIKGSVSVDPRGYPLLYVGQGISRANGRTGSIGWRVYSLIDQRELFFLDGRDPLCPRDHGAFDGVCLVDGAADTAILGGENGLFYRIKLNTRFDREAMSVSVSPRVTAYRYRCALSGELGIENSVAAWGGYAWFADNSGLLTCLDLNAMAPVWLLDTGDDTDASIALEPCDDGRLALYTVNQVDKQGREGRCTMRRVDAMTGISDWSFSVKCTSDGDNGGGGFASPLVGTGPYGDYVYFNICRTEGGGTLFCLNKADGALVWQRDIATGSWSSPVLVRRPDGTCVLVVANATGRGMLRMFDPASGKKLGGIQLRGLIEGSPAVFDDTLVVGTRDCRIYGVRLR